MGGVCTMAIVSVLNAEEDVEDPLRMAEEERGGRIKAGLGVLTVRILRSESRGEKIEKANNTHKPSESIIL